MDAKQTFANLRTLAENQRDRDIGVAKEAFKTRMAQIDQLESELSGAVVNKPPKRRVRGELKAAIMQAIPKDESFTIDDLLATMQQTIANPPNIGSLRNSGRRMHRRGELKQVLNKRNRLLKLYALPDIDCGDEITPVAALIYEVVEASNAAMRPVEICVALIEAGKALEGDPTESVGLVLRTLQDNPDRFRVNGDGYWRTRS